MEKNLFDHCTCFSCPLPVGYSLCLVNNILSKNGHEFLIFNLIFKVSMYVGARMAALEEKRLMTERGGKLRLCVCIFCGMTQVSSNPKLNGFEVL